MCACLSNTTQPAEVEQTREKQKHAHGKPVSITKTASDRLLTKSSVKQVMSVATRVWQRHPRYSLWWPAWFENWSIRQSMATNTQMHGVEVETQTAQWHWHSQKRHIQKRHIQKRHLPIPQKISSLRPPWSAPQYEQGPGRWQRWAERKREHKKRKSGKSAAVQIPHRETRENKTLR